MEWVGRCRALVQARIGFTAAFEDTAAWLVRHATLSVVVVAVLRIAWRSVSGIVGGVVTERARATDRLAGLHRIGI